jgi:4'-phosphopantetheinyl transferase
VETVFPGAGGLHLEPDNIHVWFVDLSLNFPRIAALESYLGSEERTRADRHHFSQDRTRFICSHGILRELLGAYCGQHPANIRFGCGQFGKPVVVHSSRDIPEFNCSRAGDMALFAFSLGRSLGVDIERIEEDEEFLNLATQHFMTAENEILKNLDAKARMVELFRHWTRREAYLKATGQALGHIPPEIDVSRSVIRSAGGTYTWTIKTFDHLSAYASSVASAGVEQTYNVFDYGAVPPRVAVLRTAS